MSDYSELAKKLLTLEKQKDQVTDYKALGFTIANTDELIRMATDPELLDNDDKSPLFWATVHAWYALGQLQIIDAIKPLLDLHDEYPFDQYLHGEISKAIALMGSEAIPRLKEFLWDATQSETTRSEAIFCLEKLAKKHRTECLSVFNEFLNNATEEYQALAGFIVCSLIKLRATESIEMIRSVFQRECIDISIPGDLEDVEIALGLRNKRATPRPNYNNLSPESLKSIEALRDLIGLNVDDSKPSAKTGRNDPCPCGSGKKFKKCCLH